MNVFYSFRIHCGWFSYSNAFLLLLCGSASLILKRMDRFRVASEMVYDAILYNERTFINQFDSNHMEFHTDAIKNFWKMYLCSLQTHSFTPYWFWLFEKTEHTSFLIIWIFFLFYTFHVWRFFYESGNERKLSRIRCNIIMNGELLVDFTFIFFLFLYILLHFINLPRTRDKNMLWIECRKKERKK